MSIVNSINGMHKSVFDEEFMMYFFELIEEEHALKSQIGYIESTISLLEHGYYVKGSGIILAYDNLDDAYVGLGKTKNRLKEVQNQMRKFILGE